MIDLKVENDAPKKCTGIFLAGLALILFAAAHWKAAKTACEFGDRSSKGTTLISIMEAEVLHHQSNYNE